MNARSCVQLGAGGIVLVCWFPVDIAAQANIWNLQSLGDGATVTYAITHVKNGVERRGEFQITTSSNGGQLMASVQTSLGDNSCSSTTPLQNSRAIHMQLMMSCQAFAPVTMTMFAPTLAMLAMTSWELGVESNINQGGQQFSVHVTEECSFAGLNGVLAQLRTDDTEWNTCVNEELAFPLSVMMSTDRETIVATLIQYDTGV